MLCVFVLAFFIPLIWAGCPPGTIYESSFNKCYKFVNQSLSFLAAEQFCLGLDGHLVAISNGFEASIILVDVIGTSQSLSYWIGANYLLAPSWSWTYNVSFSYSNWAPGQPADPSSTECGAVRSPDNYWTKELCYNRKPFVCSIDPNAVPVGSPTCPPTPTCPVCTMTSPAVSTTCPPTSTCPIFKPSGNPSCPGRCSGRYTQSPIDCKCYHWHYEANILSFNDSQTFCKSQNGSLIKLTSAAQNNWLVNWISDQGLVYWPWIGLTCPGSTKDVCYWVDGSPLTCYDNFDNLYSQFDQVWNGLNPNFFLDLRNGDTYFGTWLRCNPNDKDCTQAVVCMRDF